MEPFTGEIVLFSFNFAPKGYALCNGQMLSIASNTVLFSLLGTTYGGNGSTTFALPDLRGRAPGHVGNGYALGNSIGATSNTITVQQLPEHTHEATKLASANYTVPGGLAGGNGDPANAAFATNTNFPNRFSNKYDEGLGDQLSAGTQVSANAGGGQPHNNMMPYLVLNYCIALVGVFPSRD